MGDLSFRWRRSRELARLCRRDRRSGDTTAGHAGASRADHHGAIPNARATSDALGSRLQQDHGNLRNLAFALAEEPRNCSTRAGRSGGPDLKTGWLLPDPSNDVAVVQFVENALGDAFGCRADRRHVNFRGLGLLIW